MIVSYERRYVFQDDEGSEEGSSEEESDDEDVPAEFDEREGYGSGTTACVAVIQDGVITVANVGTFLLKQVKNSSKKRFSATMVS